MPPTGDGKRRVLFVAEAPGEREDEDGVQLVGKAGQRLRKTLRKFDFDLDEDAWKTNAVICRPPNNKLSDGSKEVDYCRPNLLNTVKELNPEVIVLLGVAAVKGLIGHLWEGGIGEGSRWWGWQIPSQAFNAWICPTYHPSYVVRSEDGNRPNPVPGLYFAEHLEAALSLSGRPWKKIPELKKQVRIELDPDKAARDIAVEMAFGKPLAWDYETTMLKPDGPGAEIVSCAISNGRTAFAYPWHGAAIEQTRLFLKSSVPKIGANMKYEQRWTKRLLGCEVKNWLWDTVLAAHVMDNRRGITGLKFQAFVRLGQPLWDEGVSDYLKANHPAKPNRIRQADLVKVLKYNALDALLTYKVAKQQMQEVGVDLQ